jgi:hypothetical protein
MPLSVLVEQERNPEIAAEGKTSRGGWERRGKEGESRKRCMWEGEGNGSERRRNLGGLGSERGVRGGIRLEESGRSVHCKTVVATPHPFLCARHTNVCCTHTNGHVVHVATST